MHLENGEGFAQLNLRLALQLANPHSWVASAIPALFAACYCAVKGYPLGVPKAVLLTAACILLQSAVNTLNDYYDFVNGTDSASDHVAVEDAALVYGGIHPKSALRLGIAFLAAGAALGLLCCRGVAPLLIGAMGGAAVLFYSAGPLPISYLPCGELISGFVMGGLIPLGVTACADGRLHPAVLLWSLPFILGIALIMMTNNGCDIEKDAKAGRHTLPRLLGREGTVFLYRVQSMMWLLLLAVLPVLLLGPVGLAGPVLAAALGRKHIRRLLQMRLEPEKRIAQMGTIVRTNLLGNGAYVAALLLALLAGGPHG